MPTRKNNGSMKAIAGLHHVTAVARNAQENLDFYTKVLGLRMVKLTVNFDDPGTYHFYFGNEQGEPGTVLTFFPWSNVKRGVQGTGGVYATSFNMPRSAASFWWERLSAAKEVANLRRESRFGEDVIAFEDHDGMRLELIASDEGPLAWVSESLDPSNERFALRGFHSVTLAVRDAAKTLALLTEGMGYRILATEKEALGTRTRVRASGDGTYATLVDILEAPGLPDNKLGAGVVHHVAFRVPDLEAQGEWQQALAERGLRVTPVQDRFYFQSTYFREFSHILFELATDGPGFATDESVAALGSGLCLPGQYEHARARIEAGTPKIVLGNGKVVGST